MTSAWDTDADAVIRGPLGAHLSSVVEVLVPRKTELWGSTFRRGYMAAPSLGPQVACEDPWALRTQSSTGDLGGQAFAGLRSTPSPSKREFGLGGWSLWLAIPSALVIPALSRMSSWRPLLIQRKVMALGTNPESREN